MKNSKGVVLVAVGSKGYPYMAYNMAYSIKHHDSSVKVHLIADSSFEYLPLNRRGVFDSVSTPKHEDFHTNEKLDPGKLKTRIYKYLPFDHNLYLDVDGIALKSLNPLLEKLSEDERFYITSEQGRGKQSEKINYSEWASNDVIVDAFKLTKAQEIVAIQSSWAYIQKSKESKAFFAKVQKSFDLIDPKDLNYDWGGTMPDELIFSGVISKNNMKVDGDSSIMFFGASTTPQTASDLLRDYSILSVYGNGRGKTMTPLRYWEMYDQFLFKWTKLNRVAGNELAISHIYKAGLVKQYKHANRHNKKR